MPTASRLFRPRSWPIAVKLSVELILAALVPLVLAMWLTSSQSRSRLEQQAADNVELLAGVTAARLDQLFIDTSRMAAMLAGEEVIQQFCASDAATRTQLLPGVQRKIELVIRSNPDFASILVDGADGICIAATSADMVGVDYNFREYFKRARAGEHYISPLLVGKTSSVPGVYFSVPVRADSDPQMTQRAQMGNEQKAAVRGHQSDAPVSSSPNAHQEQSDTARGSSDTASTTSSSAPSADSPPPTNPDDIVGVIVLKLDGRSVWKLIDSVHVGQRGHAMLSNADGVVVAHPDRSRLYHSFAPLTEDRIKAIDPKTQWAVSTINSLNMPALMRLAGAKEHGTQVFDAPASGAQGLGVRDQGLEGGNRITATNPQSLTPNPLLEQWIAGFAPMHERDMVVSIVQPMSEFDQPIAAMMRQQIWIVIAVAMFAAALALIQARRTVRPVLAVTHAANQLAGGDFTSRAIKHNDDEIGRLAQAFNDMVPQLKERVDMQQSLQVAMEVQQSLLPASDPTPPGLDVAGRSRYCDSTGGDYFDFLDISRVSDTTTLIALGDVMGHGVASALLMATARAALRSHAMDDGSLSNIITKVNRVLAADARHGRFMTMSLLIINPITGRVRWASAGHDPIIVYHPLNDTFDELGGGDLPLGIAEDIAYEEYQRDGIRVGDVLLIGTDGIWELRTKPQGDVEGEMFGKDRLRDFIRANHRHSAAEIAAALQQTLREYSGDGSVQDDVTFVVVRVTPAAPPEAPPAPAA